MSGGSGRGGIALDFRRGKTSKKLLEIDWVYPAWKPEEGRTGETTVAVERQRALPLEEAYALVTNGDRRPVLVLRECEQCKGTDHALLSRTLDNEQTVLLAHWFRCVKLAPNALGENQPFSTLFLREKGERVPHLFFADPDGQNRKDLPGDQAQAVLWETMFSYLERCYADDAKAAIKELRQVLGQYDTIDSKEATLKSRLDAELERNGGGSPKVKGLEADLQKLGKERAKLAAKEKELRDLALKAMAPAAAPSGPAAAK
jgi:hypothetical protein